MFGTLYIVATPIGNLADITFRALQILSSSSVVFCEDTRVTKKLLAHYDITTPCSSYHSFSPLRTIKKAGQLLKEGNDIAVVSDAGTPGISDPGVKLVRYLRNEYGALLRIETIPGPSALTAALSISGAPASSFVFLGFLPRKKRRESMLKALAEEQRTQIFYESPHRLLATLEALQNYLTKTREVIVLRELTKIHEQAVHGTAEEVHTYFQEHTDCVRGECVIVISSLEQREG